MKKWLSIALAALMLVAVMAACASPSAAPAASEAPAASAASEVPAASEAPAELKALPTINYIFNTNAGHQQIAEMLQSMWKELGFEVNIESQEWAVLQTNRTQGNFEISRHGWLGDYIDPMTFLDMWVSASGQNDANFKSEEYDRLIAEAKFSADETVRMANMHAAEKLLMESNSVLPIYYYTHTFLDNNKVTGYTEDMLLNHLMFKWAKKDDGSDINYHLGATPKSLDPQLNNATDGANIIQQCFDGLTRRDKSDKIVPGLAESWDISEDGLTWTFHLRDAKWSDGQPVKASDFVYGWRRAVDPEVACEYSYQVWYVENGEAISAGEKPVEDLGVKAIDDKTLEVKLAGPCGYFTQLTAFPTLYAVPEHVVSKNDGWALNPSTYVVNGAYKMQSYTQQDKLVLVKNENYWDAANMDCPTVVNVLTDDVAAAVAAFEAGELDFVEVPPSEDTQRMKDAGYFRVAPSLGTYFAVINLEGTQEALLDPVVRQALSLAIDREYIIEVRQNDAIPAYAYVPGGIPDVSGDFRTNGGNYVGTGDPVADMETAKQLLRDAGYDVP